MTKRELFQKEIERKFHPELQDALMFIFDARESESSPSFMFALGMIDNDNIENCVICKKVSKEDEVNFISELAVRMDLPPVMLIDIYAQRLERKGDQIQEN